MKWMYINFYAFIHNMMGLFVFNKFKQIKFGVNSVRRFNSCISKLSPNCETIIYLKMTGHSVFVDPELNKNMCVVFIQLALHNFD